MFVFALEFDRLIDLEAAVRRLERHYDLTGEFHALPLEGGRAWRLTVWAERPLRQGTVERLGGRRVEVDG